MNKMRPIYDTMNDTAKADTTTTTITTTNIHADTDTDTDTDTDVERTSTTTAAATAAATAPPPQHDPSHPMHTHTHTKQQQLALNNNNNNNSSHSHSNRPEDLLPHIPIGHPDSMMSKESVRRAVEDFRVLPTDIIVSTFPKTGTTLVTWICHLLRTIHINININDNADINTNADIKTNANANANANTNANANEEKNASGDDDVFSSSCSSFDTIYEVVPWPALSWDIGYDPNTTGGNFTPRVFKSHLRMASVYKGCNVKYVVTIRDPAKTCLSFYNFFIAKRVPFLVASTSMDDNNVDDNNDNDDNTNDNNENVQQHNDEEEEEKRTSTTTTKLLMDVSTFLMDTPFVKGVTAPPSNLRASIWEYYAEYHLLLDCPSVLVLIYEDLVADMPSEIRRLYNFMGIAQNQSPTHNTNTNTINTNTIIDEQHQQEQEEEQQKQLIARVAKMSTKDYMAQHMSKFDEPYERAKLLNRAADLSQLAPGAKIALGEHKQTFNPTATAFLEEKWNETMQPLGYDDYAAFTVAMRERNRRLFGEENEGRKEMK